MPVSEARYVDQVARREEFQQRHPQVGVERRSSPMPHWEAAWEDADGAGHVICVGIYGRPNPLQTLLDKLERAFGDSA